MTETLPGLGGALANSLDDKVMAALEKLHGQVTEIRASVADLNGALPQQAMIEQMAAQLRQQESACLEYRDAILQMRRQMDALAHNQLQNNHRILALDLAIKAKGPADDARKLVVNAEVFYEFLSKQPAAIPVAIESGHTGNSLDNEPPTTH